ncbi:unnamed protein product, partial [marine sediment metagenome]
DVFKIIWERERRADGKITEGRIIAAQYDGKEAKSTAIFFDDDWWEIGGKSMRKQFLRAPLSYRRISSYYSLKRFHPILRYWRPHKGIDYAAQIGTPVSAVGDGVVTYCGWKRDYGRFIEIRHNSTYSTTYGHLLRYAKGIRKGKRVKQGDVIGKVGSSGLSTGPHLDFRIKRWGKFVNFLKLKFPPAKKIKKKYRKKFNKEKKMRLTQLATLSSETEIPQKIKSYEEIIELTKWEK